MSYLTLENTSKIILNIDIHTLELEGVLLKNLEKYFLEIYKPYEPVDTYTYVYEGQKPSYHKHSCCPRLQSDFQNFEVPQEIKDKGVNAVKGFRQWFESVKHLLDKPDIFVERLRIKYGIITTPKAINREDTGSIKMESLTIKELEKEIDSLITEAGKFYNKSEKNTTILKKFSEHTYVAYKPDKIYTYETEYSDDEVKELLKAYDDEFKKPLKRMLIEYYRLKLNPEIKMEGHFLDQLGFMPCKYCHHSDYIPQNTDDTLKTNNKIDWSFIDQNIRFFRTLYSIHHPFNLQEILSSNENLTIAGEFNSCFEVEEVFVRDCRAGWGFYFNQKIDWDKNLKEFWKENRYFSFPKDDRFPLSIEDEFEFYFNYHQNSFSCHEQANSYMAVDIPEEAFIDHEGNFDIESYESTLKFHHLKFNKGLAEAQLLDAKYKVDFYDFDQSEHDLDYFIRTFYSDDDFEIIKFIFDETLFKRICETIKDVPNFNMEELFNRKIKRIR